MCVCVPGAGFVLEGTEPWELPETLLGTMRLHNLDLRVARPVRAHVCVITARGQWSY